jgi:hypothetical protein
MRGEGEGEENGIRWVIEQTGERVFRITVLTPACEKWVDYRTDFPTMFGLDIADKAAIEAQLDQLINEIREAESGSG